LDYPAQAKSAYLLAALDIQRIEHPAGYTSSLLPVDVKRPASEADTWTYAEKQADILHKSSERRVGRAVAIRSQRS